MNKIHLSVTLRDNLSIKLDLESLRLKETVSFFVEEYKIFILQSH